MGGCQPALRLKARPTSPTKIEHHPPHLFVQCPRDNTSLPAHNINTYTGHVLFPTATTHNTTPLYNPLSATAHVHFHALTLHRPTQSKNPRGKQCGQPQPTRTMALLQTTSLVQGLNLSHGGDTALPQSAAKQQAQRRLRPTSSLANLIHFARNPVEITSEAVENWYDGSTREERARRQSLADRKQLLYLKMRTVRFLLALFILPLLTRHFLGHKTCRLGSSSSRARRY